MAFQKIENYHDLQPGDHIAVPRLITDIHDVMVLLYGAAQYLNDGKRFYFHHGIYTGKNMEVVHIHGESKLSAKPCKVDLKEFDSGIGGMLFRVDYSGVDVFPPENTVAMAEDLVSNPQDWSKYNVLNNNCESFATYLKTGVAKSAQGEVIAKRALKVVEKLKEAALKK